MDNRPIPTTTKISDLPQENIKMSGIPEPIDPRLPPKMNSTPTTYQLLDVHPNPYGIKKPDSIPDFSESPLDYRDQQQRQQPQYALPSRDIPRETGRNFDEQVRANYIPNQKLTSDFISEQEEKHRDMWETNRKHKHRMSKLERLMEELQTPFFVGLLFFVFQLTPLHTAFFKIFSPFLPLFHTDGTKNVYGLTVISLLFGLIYYITMGVISYFSEP